MRRRCCWSRFVVWLLAGWLIGCASGGETAVSDAPFILPTASPAPTTAVIIASILTEGTLEPTATLPAEADPTPAPTATPDLQAALRLGATPDQPHCEWLTAAVADHLHQKLGLAVAIVTLPDDEALFANLASTEVGTADLTLCYLDPNQREVLQTYFGFVEFIGGPYWTDGEKRLQVLAKTAVVVPLQTNYPCVYTFLQTLRLASTDLASHAFTPAEQTARDC